MVFLFYSSTFVNNFKTKTMNYSIISCERSLDQFIGILPEIEYGEVFFISLLARSKYSNVMKGEAQLHRSGKRSKDIKHSLMKLEVSEGLYTDNKGNPISNDALVAYIKMNPRSTSIAQYKTVENIAKNIGEIQRESELKMHKVKNKLNALINSFDGEIKTIYKESLLELNNMINESHTKLTSPQTHSLTALQEAVSRRLVVDVDFDIVIGEFDFEILYSLLDEVFPNLTEVRSIIKTRGGYHVQLDLSKFDKKSGKWFNELQRLLPNSDESKVIVELVKDSFTPIPGTNQGGQEVSLLMSNINNELRFTSEIWNEITNKNSIILDPDGWDRSDFIWSFYRELITKETFENRKLYSTVLSNINK